MLRASVAMLAAVVIIGATNISPASAALPAIHCKDVTNNYRMRDFGIATSVTNMCVSNDGYLRAGLGVASGQFTARWKLRVELTYYTYPRWDGGGAYSGAFSSIWTGWAFDPGILPTGYVNNTPPIRSGLPGVYCARLYNFDTKAWFDFTCVDTNGTPRH
jgi:hypothetical protein